MASLSDSGAQASVSIAGTELARTSQALSNDNNSSYKPFPNTPDYKAQVAQAQRNFDSSAGAVGSDFNSSASKAGKMQAELAEGMFDAMEITFDLSSEKPVGDPYVVIVANYHEKDSKPGEVHNWIFAQALDAVGPDPRKVHIKQGGFPRGFELEKFQVHLYKAGRELASNVAEKRVPLTRDEAFDYLLLEYFHSHKGDTLRAEPLMGNVPMEVRMRPERERT